MDMQEDLFSYVIANLLSLTYFYSFLSTRLDDLKKISEVSFFIILSQFILFTIFYTDSQYYNSKGILKIITKYIFYFIIWIGSLISLNIIYGLHFVIMSDYITFLNNWIYVFCGIAWGIAVFLTINIVKINKNSFIILILCYYLMELLLFLNTIDVIKRNWIDPDYFSGPYIEFLIITMAAELTVRTFIYVLKNREMYSIQLRYLMRRLA